MNVIMQADNLDALKVLRQNYKGKVGLIYTDPPFSTNNVFRMDGDRASTISMAADAPLAYADVLRGQEYLDAVGERLKLAYDLLSDEGSLYLHIDCKVGYDMKVILDGIFGIDRFRNSISRIKSNPKNFAQKGYGSVKDTILFYTKSDRFVWNEPRMPPTQRRMSQFNKEDERGPYTTAPLHAPGETLRGATGMAWRGILPPKGRHWRYPPKRLEVLDMDGLIEWSKTGNPRLKVYADIVSERGVLLQDVWEFKDPQYPTYPTEKNLEMLETIVKTSSNPGDLVLDPYCGSGTALLAAAKHGRRFLGIDRSDKAIDCVQTRLAGYEFKTTANGRIVGQTRRTHKARLGESTQMTPTYMGVRVNIASPIRPIKKIKAPPTEEIVALSKLAQAIHQQTGIRLSHLSMEEDTRKLTLTPDPHELMVSEPTETAHRLPGYFLLSFLVDDNENSPEIKDGLDHSKVDWGS